MDETSDLKSLRIDHRHLAFFFLGAVCVCAVFFALGFVVGRAQAFETALRGQEELKTVPNGSNTASLEPGSASGVTETENSQVSPDPAGNDADESPKASRGDYRNDLDFYSAVKEQKVDPNFHPESPSPKNVPTRSVPAAAQKDGKKTGAVSLQVAALRSSVEADRLAKALRSKGYPVFIVNPLKEDASKLIRVQIGPYASEAEAGKVKTRLSADGYTAISKR